MKDNILTIIFIIRKYLKKEFENFPMSCCFESSLVTQKVFSKLGYNVQTIEGKLCGAEHYWNIVNDFLCDVSSDQFNKPFGVINDRKDYTCGIEYSLEEELDWFNGDDDDIYEELLQIKNQVEHIADKCIKQIYLYKCA